MSPTDGTFIHVDASMNKLLKAFSFAKVKQRFVLGVTLSIQTLTFLKHILQRRKESF